METRLRGPMLMWPDFRQQGTPPQTMTATEQPTSPTGTADTGDPIRSYRWVMVFGMVLNSWAMTLPALSFGLLLPEIREEFSLNLSQGGWLGSSVRVGNLLVTLPAAFVLSQFRPVKVVIASLVVGSILTLLHGFASGFLFFLMARIAFGISFSVRAPSRAMIIQQWVPLREVALVQGIIIGLIGVAEFAALYGTPLILEATGNWRTAYYIFAAYAAFVALYWIILGRERKPTTGVKHAGMAPFSTVLRYPVLWVAGLGAFCATFNWLGFATFWPTFMLEENHTSLKTSGLLFGIISLATIPAAIGVGWVGSRIRNRRALVSACGLVMLGGSVGLLYTTQIWALVFLVIGIGLAWGYVPLVLSLPFELPRISQSELAVATSIPTLFFLAGGVVGPIIVGAISDLADSTRGALMVAALAPAGIALTGLFIPEAKHGSSS